MARKLTQQEKETLFAMAVFVDMKTEEGEPNPWIKELPQHKKACQLFFRRGWLTLKSEFENTINGTKSIGYKMSQKGYDEANRLFDAEKDPAGVL